MSFPNAENEEVLKNLLFILKAKIPLEFNLPVMDLKLLQTVEFFFYHGSRGNSLKQDFIANRIFVPEASSRRCPYLAVGDRPGRGGDIWQETFLCRDIRRVRGGAWVCTPAQASLQGLCPAWGLVPCPLPRETGDALGWVGCSAGAGTCPVLTGDALDAWLPHWDPHPLSDRKAPSLL